MARPTKFTGPLGAKICKRIAEGESLRSVCRDEKMPNRSTVHEWIILGTGLDPKPGLKAFSDQYERAIAVRAENMFDEMEEIADDGTNDWMTKTGRDGEEYEVVNTEHIQRSRLRVDTRKWKLSKMLPKKFGDRQVVTTEDEEGNAMPIKGNVITFVSDGDNS
ncbi:terminase small subunit [Caudoviricetes sp.]|nr:terminase small subunit [Caudoviricetes sp.]